MPISDRQRLEHREWYEAEAAREAAEREERERPIREAAAAVARTHAELIQVERDNILKLRDDSFRVDSAVANLSLPQAEADRFNAESAAAFVDATPEYYPSDHNHEILCDYLTRNGCMIANEATWKLVYNRLASLSLLESWPVPEPELEPEPQQEQAADPMPGPHEGYPVAKHQPNSQEPQYLDGWDYETGEPKRLSRYEADRLTSEEYRQFLRIPRVTKTDWGRQ